MLNIDLITVGKIKEKYLIDGINEYLKRITSMACFNIIEVKEYATGEIYKDLKNEAILINKYIKDSDFVVHLAIDGTFQTSEMFSKFIENHFTYQKSKLIFIIGSSHGICPTLRYDYKLSLSKMTFPHQLVRLIFVEQIYRGLAIINNLKYHK